MSKVARKTTAAVKEAAAAKEVIDQENKNPMPVAVDDETGVTAAKKRRGRPGKNADEEKPVTNASNTQLKPTENIGLCFISLCLSLFVTIDNRIINTI